MKKQKSHDVRAVANFMLDIFEKEGEHITIINLMKLLYLAQGWSIVLNKAPLISTQPKQGVSLPLYEEISSQLVEGPNGIKSRLNIRGIPPHSDLSEEGAYFIYKIMRYYGSLGSNELTKIVHKIKGCDIKEDEFGDEISLEKMEKDFRLFKERPDGQGRCACNASAAIGMVE